MFVPGKPFQPSLMFVGEASGVYYKTITIVIMMIISDAPNCGIITYDHN